MRELAIGRIIHLSIFTVVTFVSTFMLSQDISAQEAEEQNTSLIEEIIVTARKREESIQTVPGSVDAFSGATIEKLQIKTIEDTFGTVPGLYFTGNFLSPGRDFRQLVIRGVGANSQLEPSTATFIDGVYSPALAFDLSFLDIERIEVLKGPQGALFGRNTEAGALNIITRKPNEESQGKVYFELDEFDTYEVSASISGALSKSKNIFGRLSVLYSQTDGYIKNNASVATPATNVINNVTGVPIPRAWDHNSLSRRSQDEGEQRVLAGSLVFQPNDAVEVIVAADYSKYEGGDASPGPLSSCKCFEVNGDSLFDHESENSGASLTLNWDLDMGVLTAISGWRSLESSTPWDFDGDFEYNGSPRLGNVHDFDMKQEILSQEIRFASDSDSAVNWLAGVYLFDEINDSDRFYNFPNLDDPGGAAPQQFLDGLWNEQIVNIDRKGWAVFGQLTWDINDQLELAVGGRLSDEKADVEALERYAFPLPGFNSVLGYPDVFTSVDQGDWQDFYTPVEDSESWDNFSPSVSLKYRFSPDAMAYFSYAAGFKAGSYQKAPVAVADVVPIDPETIDSYELGFKSLLADGRVQFNAAAYFIQLEDMQLQAAVIRNGIIASAITNAAKSEVKGFELSVSAYPTDRLLLNLNYGYTNSEFTDYKIIPDGVNVVDRTGDPFPNTPESTFAFSAEYTWSVGGDMDLIGYANYRFVDDTYVGSDSVSVDPIIPVSDWDQVDIKLSLVTQRWRLMAFVDNVTDEHIVVSKWNPFFVEPNSAFIHDRVAAPRRVGISFTYNFWQ